MMGAMTTQRVQQEQDEFHEGMDWSTVDFGEFPVRIISLDEEPEE